MNQKNFYRLTAVILLIEAFLIFAPMAILGSAINWPASLDEPASVNLPLILEQSNAVVLGYFIYLIYSLLFWPLALLTGRVIAGEDSQNPLLQIASGFAIISTLARVLGIIRWLFPMPVLARIYVDPATSAPTKETISIVYDMLNTYAGTIGEVLGVSLFAALWVGLIGVLILRRPQWPRWLGYFGLVAALALSASLLEVVGLDLGAFISVTTAILHFWFMAAAVVFLRRAGKLPQHGQTATLAAPAR